MYEPARISQLLAGLAVACVLASASVQAAAPVPIQPATSLQDAVERVQSQTAGRILSAETVRVGKQKLYRVKVLLRDGHVRVIQVPAASNK
jgi:hypothetical protein